MRSSLRAPTKNLHTLINEADIARAAGEKRTAGAQTSAKVTKKYDNKDDIDMGRRKVVVTPTTPPSQPTDHLHGIGKMTVIHDREKNDMVKHDATHRHPPGFKCEDAWLAGRVC